ncbi:MAG: RsiV family protein, partial [Lachnospiraceae bacterium]|nr:RsiV family protein [Lachnospiraceae bacterium]
LECPDYTVSGRRWSFLRQVMRIYLNRLYIPTGTRRNIREWYLEEPVTFDRQTEKYNTDQFFLFPEGIGLYYRRDTINCSAAGDFVFIIPWDEVK